MMKIALNGILVNRRFSGVETAILNLARGLARFGRETYCLFLPERARVEDVRGDRFATRRVALPAHLRLLRILWEQAILPGVVRDERADLLHAPGYVAPLRSRVPFVLTVYDLIALLFPAWCKTSNRLHYGLMLPRSMARAAGIIVPSERTRRDILDRWPLTERRIRVIPLGISDDFKVLRDEEKLTGIRKRYDLPEKFILFVGRIEPKKNIPGLLAAFRDLKTGGDTNHKLVLAGAKDWAFGDVWRRTRDLGLEQEVRFLGYVPPEDLPGLYNLADVFVFPSLYEGFGLPPLEAMACGAPVVASNRGSLPETVGDAGVLVDPLRHGEIADAMRELIRNPAARKGLIEKGMRRAMQFSWRQTVERTEAFYGEILQRAGSEAGKG